MFGQHFYIYFLARVPYAFIDGSATSRFGHIPSFGSVIYRIPPALFRQCICLPNWLICATSCFNYWLWTGAKNCYIDVKISINLSSLIFSFDVYLSIFSFLGTYKYSLYGFGALMDVLNGSTWEQSVELFSF